MATNTTKLPQPIKFNDSSRCFTKEFIEWKMATKFPKLPKEAKDFIIKEYYAPEHPCSYNDYNSEPRYVRGKRMWGYGWYSIEEQFQEDFDEKHMKALEYFIGE